jgi:hypothetical protein
MSSINFLQLVKPRSAIIASIKVDRNESQATSLRGLV